jgi:N-acyl-D-amino-acid deacylase
VLWDPALTPSCWHGVTSVLMGNCGYSMAPAKPEHRDLLLRTLEAVEGMSLDSLTAGVQWSFESFPQYLDTLDAAPLRLNVAAMLGHSALRYHVLGEEAPDRTATEAEVQHMSAVLDEALEAGAAGFSTSRASVDNGAHGKPVPSRLADWSELLALMDVLARRDRGVVQILPGNLRPDVRAAIADVTELADRSCRPVLMSSVLTGLFGPRGNALAALEQFTPLARGAVVPLVACRPIVQQVTLRDPFFLTTFSSAFLEALGHEPADRQQLYARADWRQRAREGLQPMAVRLAEATIAETTRHVDLGGGTTLGELASQRGSTPLDVLVDLSLEDDLATRFRVPLVNDDEVELAELLRDPRGLVSLSLLAVAAELE